MVLKKAIMILLTFAVIGSGIYFMGFTNAFFFGVLLIIIIFTVGWIIKDFNKQKVRRNL